MSLSKLSIGHRQEGFHAHVLMLLNPLVELYLVLIISNCTMPPMSPLIVTPALEYQERSSVNAFS